VVLPIGAREHEIQVRVVGAVQAALFVLHFSPRRSKSQSPPSRIAE
jgi:hypothetical protein